MPMAARSVVEEVELVVEEVGCCCLASLFGRFEAPRLATATAGAAATALTAAALLSADWIHDHQDHFQQVCSPLNAKCSAQSMFSDTLSFLGSLVALCTRGRRSTSSARTAPSRLP